MAVMVDARPGGVRWRFARALPIMPVLVAEAILWMGFGALLPVLPLYITEQGIDTATLGWIVAAWPAARLLGEPLFGWLADRGDKRVLMLGGLIGTAVAVPLPLVFTGVAALIAARALAGFTTAAYDPAARGYIMDATAPDERGAAFGLYGSAQMGGLLLGPAIGGIGAALGGGYVFPFVFCSVALVASAALLAATTLRRPIPRHDGAEAVATTSGSAVAPDGAGAPSPADPREGVDAEPDPAAPSSLWNRILVGAIVINVGSYFASGTYEVVWSLWMTELGADLGLIGLTFAAFGLGVLLVSPIAGQWVDRLGPIRFVVAGSLGAAAAGILYALLVDPVLVIPVVIFEGVSFALLGPALYAIVARATPAGRSSTTQGVFGAAGTLGTIVASIAAGVLFAIDIQLPFYVFAVTMVVSLGVGLLVGGRELRSLGPVQRSVAEPESGEADGPGLSFGPLAEPIPEAIAAKERA
jgi:DHA1 family multidrug resistance protein-like MFS transporter